MAMTSVLSSFLARAGGWGLARGCWCELSRDSLVFGPAVLPREEEDLRNAVCSVAAEPAKGG